MRCQRPHECVRQATNEYAPRLRSSDWWPYPQQIIRLSGVVPKNGDEVILTELSHTLIPSQVAPKKLEGC